MTNQDILLFLVLVWAVGATLSAIEYRRIALEQHELLKRCFNLACHITKDESVRRDFEVNVVDKLIQLNKEQ